MKKALGKFLNKNKYELIHVKRKLMSSPHHQWIVNDQHLNRSFQTLLEHLPPESYRFFMQKDILFLRVGGELAGAFRGGQENGYVLVFDDLIKMLKSAAWYLGIAVLAHELGHLYYNHSNKSIDTQQAQLEADDFARQCGLARELIQVLSDYSEQENAYERIERLKQVPEL
jgi:predicted Zn-dependent protease